MANYGILSATNQDKFPFKGKLITPTFGGEIALRPNLDAKGDKAPSHEIVMNTPNGVCEIGAAWKRETEKGAPMFSLQIDHPGMDKPLWLSAFKSDKNATDFDIVWTRPKQPAQNAGNTQKPDAFGADA